jgi:hypothetical protein
LLLVRAQPLQAIKQINVGHYAELTQLD